MIDLDDVVLALPGFTLGPLTLSVARGEYLVIVGPSGAGKSLLLETICGFRHAASGVMRLRGLNTAGMTPQQRRLGWVPQSSTLFPHLTARQNITFGPRAHGRAEDLDEIARRWATRLGIAHLLDRGVPALSAGERQRVALARALANEADILLLDEPFSSLDFGRRRDLWHLMSELHRSYPLTILHVTHDLDAAGALGTTAAVLSSGTLLAKGTPDAILDPARNAAVAQALGTA